MEQKRLSVFANIIWNSIGSFTYLACQWLLTLIVVREFNDFGYAGNFALAISVTNIFYNFACFNVRPYLVSDLNEKYSSKQYCTFRLYTCICAFVLCLCYAMTWKYGMQQIMCIVAYMVYKETEAWTDLLHAFEQRQERMDIGGISLFIRGILSLICFYVGIKITNDLFWAIVFMTCTVIVFIICYDYPRAKKIADISIDNDIYIMRKMLSDFLPLTIGTILGVIGTTLPKQILQDIYGSSILGIYNTVATPAVLVQVVASYIFNPMLVEFARLYREKNKQKLIKNILMVCIVLIVLIAICFVGAKAFGKAALTFLYGNKVAEYSSILLLLILFTGLNAFVWFFWNILILMRKQKQLLYINLFGVIIGYLIMTPLISKYEMNGVSYVLTVYSIILIVMMINAMIRELKTIV